ncbi:PAQR family membrane homeostasis protein TrhA [Roseivirga sp.]|uniref:PAQR family membrane homeostasis protein TrhA n=1 Tax=Roseivirga sp. TaxID=1964215 RepID=UPI003B8C8D25
MTKKIKLDLYSPEEELANAITHGVGIIGGIIGLVLTLQNSALNPSNVTWSGVIFFLSIIFLYTASTIYHSISGQKKKYLFKQLDHIGIYILIAGTFTPFAWGILGNDASGQNMIIAVWLIALAGILFKVFYTGKFEAISLISYVGMGWLGFLMFDDITKYLGRDVVDLMLYGGVFYTSGIIFYLMRRLKYHHAIWHLFVLAGTGFHVWGVLKYVIRI